MKINVLGEFEVGDYKNYELKDINVRFLHLLKTHDFICFINKLYFLMKFSSSIILHPDVSQ